LLPKHKTSTFNQFLAPLLHAKFFFGGGGCWHIYSDHLDMSASHWSVI